MSYQPPGGIAAPDYGRPPRKNRAGVFIALMLILLVAVLGTGVWVATKVVANIKPTADDPPPPAPVTSVAPVNSPKPKPKPKPSPPVKTAPVKPVPVTPPGPQGLAPTQLAERLVTSLNANDTKGASALACPGFGPVIVSLMQAQLKAEPKLVAGTSIVSADKVVTIQLGGTMNGSAVTGIILIMDQPKGLCVRAFSVTQA